MSLAFERSYWDKRYRDGYDSGAGSRPDQVAKKVGWLSNLSWISSVVEIGCGDFQFGRRLMDRYPDARYWGYDVSEFVVERNQLLYGLPRVQFFPAMGNHFPPCDLLLCVDVLLHIIEDDDHFRMLQTLHDARWRYLAMTAYEYEGPNDHHVRIRKFDPMIFGAPVIREVIEEDGDMMFYLWQR